MTVGTSVLALFCFSGLRAARRVRASLAGATAVALLSVLSVSTAFAQTTTVTAAWDRNTDTATAGYLVYYGTAPGNYQWSYDAGNQVSAALTLTPGSAYYVAVRAYNTSAQVGQPSNEATINLVTAAPTAQITATMQNATTALVTWQTTNAVSAVINGTAVPLSGSAPVALSATTTFTMVATGASGATATQSATATVTPPSSSTPSATNMAATVSGARATLSWLAPTTGAAPDRYLLYVGSTAGGSSLANGFVVGNVLTVSADLPRGRYYARVRAANNSGASADSNEVSFKIGRNLVAPRGFTVLWIGTTAVLSWTAPAADGAMEDRPTSYVLEAGTTPGASDVATVPVGNVTRFEANVPSGTYYVRVRAVNEYGDSEPTPDLMLVAPGAPRAPTNLASTGSGSVNLRWTAPAGTAPTGYIIEAGTAPGRADLGVLQVGNVTSFTAPAPPPGAYYVRVRAINARGAGQPSNEVVVRR